MQNRKREAEDRISRDDSLDDDGLDAQPQHWQAASAEVMQGRRILRVRRPTAAPEDVKPTGAFTSLLGANSAAGGGAVGTASTASIDSTPTASAPSATPKATFASLKPNAALVPSVFGSNTSSISFDFSKKGSGIQVSTSSTETSENPVSSDASSSSSPSVVNVFQTNNFSFNFKLVTQPRVSNAVEDTAGDNSTACDKHTVSDTTTTQSQNEITSKKVQITKLFPPPAAGSSSQLHFKLLKFEVEPKDDDSNQKEADASIEKRSWRDHGSGYVEMVEVPLHDDDNMSDPCDNDDRSDAQSKTPSLIRLIMRRVGTHACMLDIPVYTRVPAATSSSTAAASKLVENTCRVSHMFKLTPNKTALSSSSSKGDNAPVVFVGYHSHNKNAGMFCIKHNNTSGKSAESSPSHSGNTHSLKTLRDIIVSLTASEKTEST